MDNSERSFYKELAKVIEASDVILQVLDARDPIGTRCNDMEKMVLKAGPEKHLVLLLNKIGRSSYPLKMHFLICFPVLMNQIYYWNLDIRSCSP